MVYVVVQQDRAIGFSDFMGRFRINLQFSANGAKSGTDAVCCQPSASSHEYVFAKRIQQADSFQEPGIISRNRNSSDTCCGFRKILYFINVFSDFIFVSGFRSSDLYREFIKIFGLQGNQFANSQTCYEYQTDSQIRRTWFFIR